MTCLWCGNSPAPTTSPFPAGAESVCWEITAGRQRGDLEVLGGTGGCAGVGAARTELLSLQGGREGSRGILRTPGLPLLTQVVEKVV